MIPTMLRMLFGVAFCAVIPASALFDPGEQRAATNRREIATFAGTGQPGFSGDGGPATKAQFDNPFGIVRGPDGGLYICDANNHVIRKVSSDGNISTVAGTGKRGYSGDGGLAMKAELNEPYEVRFDTNANMFFVERLNHVVRRVDAKTQRIDTVAGMGSAGFGGDGGPATRALLSQPHSIQFDSKGDLYICDIGNHRIRKIEIKTGIISTFAGTGAKASTPDGAAIEGIALNGPRAIDFDQDGNMWLALREGNAVYKIDMERRTIHHVAGTGAKGFTGNGGPAKEATLSGPKGLSIGPDRNIYLADTESHTIRMIDVRKNSVELLAGTGERGDGPEGDALACKMARPHGVFVDRDGSIFVGDTETNRVRRIRPAKFAHAQVEEGFTPLFNRQGLTGGNSASSEDNHGLFRDRRAWPSVKYNCLFPLKGMLEIDRGCEVFDDWQQTER